MEVRLKSEVRPPPKPGAVLSMVLLLLGASGLSIYGLGEWYFAKQASWWLAAPLALLGVLAAVAINRTAPDTRLARTRRVGGSLVMLLFVPAILGAGFAVGAPALWLRLLGPDRELTATVSEKRRDPSSRSCRRKVVLSQYSTASNARFCVGAEEFDRLDKGRKVVVATREGYFGTLAFSIRPSDWGPE